MFFAKSFLNNISIVESVGGGNLNKFFFCAYCTKKKELKMQQIDTLITEARSEGMIKVLAKLFNITVEINENETFETLHIHLVKIWRESYIQSEILYKKDPDIFRCSWTNRNNYINLLNVNELITWIFFLRFIEIKGIPYPPYSSLLANPGIGIRRGSVEDEIYDLFPDIEDINEYAFYRYIYWLQKYFDFILQYPIYKELYPVKSDFEIKIFTNHYITELADDDSDLGRSKAIEIHFLSVLFGFNYYLKNQTFDNYFKEQKKFINNYVYYKEKKE